MIQTFFIRLLQMLLLVAAQVLALNHMQLWGYGTPLIFVSLLVYMPLGASRISTLLWAFCTGLLVDVFSNTPGVACGAMTFVAMLQPPLLKLMVPRDAAEDVQPTYRSMGRWNHARYIFLLYLIHHCCFYMLESFSFFNWKEVLLAFGSSLLSSVLIALSIENFRNSK